MNNAALDARLLAVASLVRRGARFADVGTDHAYLPLYLLDTGVIASAVAADIAEGPLASARANVLAAGRERDVTLMLANGLSGMDDLGLTDIAICGMGGELIVDILMAAPFVKNADIRLLLQPMSRAEVLRAYLASEGFAVTAERYAIAAGRAYLCLAVAYTGVPYEVDPVCAVLGDRALRSEGDSVAYAAYLNAREREALCRLRGKKSGGLATDAEDALLFAIKKEREVLA